MACFHTLWSAGSVKVMPGINDLVPLYQDSITFLSVRADGQGMAAISKELKVSTFPTVIIFSGGKEIDRIEGHERAVEMIVRSITAALTPEDKVARAKHRHRIRLERALERGESGAEVEEEDIDEPGQVLALSV